MGLPPTSSVNSLGRNVLINTQEPLTLNEGLARYPKSFSEMPTVYQNYLAMSFIYSRDRWKVHRHVIAVCLGCERY
jgi:hypothetical protein